MPLRHITPPGGAAVLVDVADDTQLRTLYPAGVGYVIRNVALSETTTFDIESEITGLAFDFASTAAPGYAARTDVSIVGGNVVYTKGALTGQSVGQTNGSRLQPSTDYYVLMDMETAGAAEAIIKSRGVSSETCWLAHASLDTGRRTVSGIVRTFAAQAASSLVQVQFRPASGSPNGETTILYPAVFTPFVWPGGASLLSMTGVSAPGHSLANNMTISGEGKLVSSQGGALVQRTGLEGIIAPSTEYEVLFRGPAAGRMVITTTMAILGGQSVYGSIETRLSGGSDFAVAMRLRSPATITLGTFLRVQAAIQDNSPRTFEVILRAV